MLSKKYYVYILASRKNGTLYVGMTGDLKKRIAQHHYERFIGFTKKYGIKRLVYFEKYLQVMHAIHREKQLKRWLRKWKIQLIERVNPYWDEISVGE